MLRTAGLVMQAPQAPQLNVWVEQLSVPAAGRLLAQTLRPQAGIRRQLVSRVQATARGRWHRLPHCYRCPVFRWQPVAAGRVESAGAARKRRPRGPGLGQHLGPADPHRLQTRHCHPGRRVARRGSHHGEHRPRPATGARPQATAALAAWAATQPTLALRKPPATCEQAPNIPPQKTVLIAGHDLEVHQVLLPLLNPSPHPHPARLLERP
ncbi:MAG: hypothetical protein MZV65_05160 [Chromatiales bacterium]|nr:hypothetical protein [Chromatiales bacterium]